MEKRGTMGQVRSNALRHEHGFLQSSLLTRVVIAKLRRSNYVLAAYAGLPAPTYDVSDSLFAIVCHFDRKIYLVPLPQPRHSTLIDGRAYVLNVSDQWRRDDDLRDVVISKDGRI